MKIFGLKPVNRTDPVTPGLLNTRIAMCAVNKTKFGALKIFCWKLNLWNIGYEIILHLLQTNKLITAS